MLDHIQVLSTSSWRKKGRKLQLRNQEELPTVEPELVRETMFYPDKLAIDTSD